MMATASRIVLEAADDVAGFWTAAFALDAADVPPEAVLFEVAGEAAPDLFGNAAPARAPDGTISAGASVSSRLPPPELKTLFAAALLHADPERFRLAYRLLRRMRGAPYLLAVASDADVARIRRMEKAVRRDMHKMTAFVRFREVTADDGTPVFIAWFEPEHHIVAAVAPFFMRRFAGMRWSILTPRRCAHWDGDSLTISPGASRASAPAGDPIEAIWRTYYASIFNPARLKVKAMLAEMPKKYWRNLPETEMIKPLVKSARARSADMIAAPADAPRRPVARQLAAPAAQTPEVAADHGYTSLAELAADAARCRRCPLYAGATQTVFGEGPSDARLMLVGEQPGDEEDIAGRPFVGPAGRVLDAALERCGIDRRTCFVTNAVKHFKFEPRGKRRLHKRPSASEIDHCRWWVDHERRLVKPDLVVALGATAARSVVGRPVTVGSIRGEVVPLDTDAHVLVTVHPSFLLRITDPDQKRAEWRHFLSDLGTARRWIEAR